MKRNNVLIIDDDTELRKYIVSTLNSLGCKTIEASDGEEGLAFFQDFQIDLVITDIYMPKMNGIELIQNIRQLDSKINIVAMSGDFRNHNHNSLEWAKAMGALEIIEKPFDHQDFVSKVQAIIHE
ncbi:MAG: response regulator [Candidatus Marinimicrobia bacterium]|jgi:CheY-like chemotaxis protein|nr:response regulator [Candidatus Neomarinimicrobiota bacterium]